MAKKKLVLKRKVEKGLSKLPQSIRSALFLLLKEIEEVGVVRGNWPNYSKLSKTKHHCHLKRGRPTYVACWEEIKERNCIEVYYVGTHEKAPY